MKRPVFQSHSQEFLSHYQIRDICPYVRIEQIVSFWKSFSWNFIFEYFWKIPRKFEGN